jgi:ADP-ribosylation factor GTPase-activating protein 2/3
MKVGGNTSASEFFTKNGGAGVLNSKEAKVKYTSRPALAYRDELKRRAAIDAKVHPDSVVPGDIGEIQEQERRKSEDFFEAWDKPMVHKPTPPPSRTATPPVLGRTPSPSNGASANGKSKTPTPSPLSTEPTSPRTTTSSALRASKPANVLGARRTGGVGAKKTTKPAIKKVANPISFEEAEKAAKEEAERIEKWGIDEAELKKSDTLKPALSPTSFSAKTTQTKSSVEVEKLGMGVQKLGFGMVTNAPSKPTAVPAKAVASILPSEHG